MAQKHGIYVYSQDCEDFSTTGLVGDLKPLEATFTEVKNGECELVIKLPYDEYKRWQSCKVGNILKCEVPVRIPPVIADDEYANSTEMATSSE